MTRDFRCLIVGAACVVSLLAMSPANAQSQYQVEWCADNANVVSPTLRIRSCTELIRLGRWNKKDLSWALQNRGSAYNKRAEYGRAVADLNKAIRLDPENTSVYFELAYTYLRTGHYRRFNANFNRAIDVYNRAIADYTLY
jgi:tetratricopeptide (TPR) repeat protein